MEAIGWLGEYIETGSALLESTRLLDQFQRGPHTHKENAKWNQGEKLPIIAKQLENVNQSQLGMRRVAKEKGTKSATRKIGKSQNDNGQKAKRETIERTAWWRRCYAMQCKFFQLLYFFGALTHDGPLWRAAAAAAVSGGAKPLGNFINNKLSDVQTTHIWQGNARTFLQTLYEQRVGMCHALQLGNQKPGTRNTARPEANGRAQQLKCRSYCLLRFCQLWQRALWLAHGICNILWKILKI